jgi:hypothetical protein
MGRLDPDPGNHKHPYKKKENFIFSRDESFLWGAGELG